jgi:hypothetical protein
VANLPVDLVKADDQWEIDVEKGLADGEEGRMKVRRRTQKMRRAFKQRLLHKFIELALKPLFERASAGISVKDASGTSRTCHSALFSYVADFPEALDIGCTVHTQTACAAMLLERSWHLRKSASLEMPATRSRGLGSWPQLYVSTFRSALLDWQFMNLHRWLSLPSTLRFEKLHNFFLGMSRMHSTCASARLKSEKLETSTWTQKVAQRSLRMFGVISSRSAMNFSSGLKLIRLVWG